MGSGAVETSDILFDIESYLNGLDNIVQASGDLADREVFCESPVYGHFVIAISKMMGDDPDEVLFQEIMEPKSGKCRLRFVSSDLPRIAQALALKSMLSRSLALNFGLNIHTHRVLLRF